jgi:pSer/pThr/pTyr-binding forkhead associated (FHA) protein
MNELRVIFGGRSYTFPPGQTVLIGRLPDNNVVVGDPTVSRRHAS